MDPVAHLRETLLEKLRSRVWRPGHRIPAERELGEQFGLSRSTVRRVLAQLKDQGLITQAIGSGTFVAEKAGEVLAQMDKVPAAAISPAELMGARLALEPAIIDMVIGGATAADFARMDECCDRGEAAPTLEEFEHWDGLLHEAIAAAAHNSFVLSVFRLMNEARAQGEWGMMKRRSATPERRTTYEMEHRELVAALKSRDALRARELCFAHLMRVRKNLLGF
jgi:DNA-binding FadR family transcriptional regulator